MIEIIEFLLAWKEGAVLLRTILRFLRKKALKDIETSKELLDIDDNIKKVEVIHESHLPVVKVKIDIGKNIYMVLLPQKIMLRLTCEEIPLKRFYWYDGCDICDTHTSAISAGLGKRGDINVTYRCVNVLPLSGIVGNVDKPKWRLEGVITYRCKLGDFNRKIVSSFTLKEEKEEKLKTYLTEFQKFAERGTK